MKTLALLFVAVFSLSAADLYRLSGTVVNAATNAPFPRAHVVITKAGSSRSVAIMVTGDGGRFSFDLPEGKYSLRAGTRDLHQNYGIARPDASVGSSVFVGAGQDTSALVFRWFPPAAIAGKVVDGNAEPVENALIQLVRSSVTAGRRVTATSAWAYTNDLGEFRFGPIVAGSYYLTANGEPWYVQPAFPGQTPTNVRPPSYRTVHYPNAIDPARAQVLSPKPGEEVRADFTLTEAPGATVTVNYKSPPDFTGTIALIAAGIGSSEAFQREARAYGNHQILTGVPPGSYTVRVSGSSGNVSMAGRQPVEVNGADVSVEVEVHPFAAVSGRVQFPNSAAKPQGSFFVALVHDATPGSLSTVVRPDGSYSFPGAASGKYRVVLRGSGYFASEVRVEGADFRDGVVSLDNGQTATISVVASDEMGSLKGTLTQAGKTVAGGMIVLAPAAGSTDNLYRGFQTDSDGTYDFQNVRTGEYFLFVSPDPDIEYTNQKAVQPYLKAARQVRVTKKAATVEDIGLRQ
jgi:hypothetical protein